MSARLKQVSVGQAALREFWEWRQTPGNLEVWKTVHAGRRTFDRFVVRRGGVGYSVVDIWTGKAAALAMTSQTGISALHAEHTAGRLNRRAANGDRFIPQ
jgi:hypothetical protein